MAKFDLGMFYEKFPNNTAALPLLSYYVQFKNFGGEILFDRPLQIPIAEYCLLEATFSIFTLKILFDSVRSKYPYKLKNLSP